MDKKKRILIGALCAITMMGIPSLSPSVEASGAGQEAHARQLAKDNLPNQILSQKVALVDATQRMQKRICNANGIEVTETPFSKESDYKTKIHPVKVLEHYNNASCFGGGLIYAGADFIKSTCLDGADEPTSMYNYVQLEELFGHEVTHGQKRHNIYNLFNLGKDREMEAEEGSVAKLENVPEGGWGGYILSISKNINRPKQNGKVFATLEGRTNGAVTLSTALTEKNRPTYYHSSDGKTYNFHFNLDISGQDNEGIDENTYLAGQIAECIAKNALSLDNIQIWDREKIGDAGIAELVSGLIVCESPNLPTTRVLTDIAILTDRTPEQAVADMRRALPEIKRLVADGTIPLKDYNMGNGNWETSRAYKKLEQYLAGKWPQVWSQDVFRLWLICAIAQDNANR